MTHKNTVKTRRAKENSAILEETQSQCTVGRRSLLLWDLSVARGLDEKEEEEEEKKKNKTNKKKTKKQTKKTNKQKKTSKIKNKKKTNTK